MTAPRTEVDRLAAARAHGYDVEDRRPNEARDRLIRYAAVLTGQKEAAVRVAWGVEREGA